MYCVLLSLKQPTKVRSILLNLVTSYGMSTKLSNQGGSFCININALGIMWLINERCHDFGISASFLSFNVIHWIFVESYQCCHMNHSTTFFTVYLFVQIINPKTQIECHQMFLVVNVMGSQIHDIYLQFLHEQFHFHMSCNSLCYNLFTKSICNMFLTCQKGQSR